MGILHHLAGNGDVLLEGLGAGVDHNGGEAVVDAGLAGLEAVAVVQMQADGQAGLNLGGLHQLDKVGAVGIGAGTLGNLQDHRGVQLFAGLGDALNDLHIVDVESADGVAALVGLLEHLGRSNQRHSNDLLY